MNRAVIFVGLVLLILGLAVVHFSLANAQPGTSPFAVPRDATTHTPIPATPTLEATPTPLASASISPTSGSVGSSIQVSGSNFGSNESVSIKFNNQQIATIEADSGGFFSTSVDVPAFPSASYPVRVGSFTYTFKITSSFSVNPSSGPPGNSIKVNASGFNPGSSVDITMDGNILSTAKADNNGRVITTVDIPSNTSGGSKSIAITSTTGGEQSTFKVTAILSVVGQSQAAPGDIVSVSGTGFRSGEAGISVTLKGIKVLSGVIADSKGGWSETFEVPNLPAGSHSLMASGSSTASGDVAQAKITLGAGLRIEPTSGAPGTLIKINGSGARSRERISVIVGNNLATVDVNASTQGIWTADLTIPTAPGGRLIIVASGAGGKGAETSFTVTPAISVVKPTGFPGSRLTLRGEGFQANQSGIPINFGESIVGSASADPLGSWAVEISIPHAAAGTYPVSVPGNSSALRLLFSVTAGVSLSSGQGSPGETVTVIGSGFVSDEKDITLRLGDKTMKSGIIANSDGTWDTQIKIPPLPAGAYRLSASGSVTSSVNITEDVLVLGPLLTVNVPSGTPGMAINVSGKGFGSNESEIDITFDGVVVVKGVSADVVGAFARSFVVPLSPSGTHIIDVNQFGGSGNGNGRTEIGFPIQPGITLEYTEGPPGNPIQVFGSGFGANELNISLIYDGSPVVSGVSADALGSFQESFDLPPSGAGTHSIQAKSPLSGTTGTPGQDFTVLPSLALNEITGNVGLKVMVTGQGFEPGSTVSLFYDEQDQATVTEGVDKLGSFRLEFPIPESPQGDHVLRLLDDQENKQQISFTVEDEPPGIPSLQQPTDGGSGGFLGGFRPETSWSAVEDPSGVRYTLQIAADQDFEQIILEKVGLENPRYTLAEEEKLPRGDYFWRVQTVDKASNESEWSDSRAIKSGLMPIWLLAMLVALGLVATGGGAYALLNSRRRVREEAIPPEFIRILQPEAAPALGTPTTAAPALAAPAPTRRALPSPFRRARGLSPEEQARIQMVVDFVSSIPLLELSSDLSWLEEMIETMGGVKEDVYEQVLKGEIDLAYQPAWLQHPTYEDLRVIPQAEPFVQGLEGYIGVVNQCASDTVVLLRRIAGDLSTAPPMGTLNGNQWRFALTVGLGTLAWFRGTYLGQPSSRDYKIQAGDVSESWDPEGPPPMELHGSEASPFPELILDGLSEEDASFFRDLHIQLRISYRTYEEARTLASRLASTDAMRARINDGISQLGQLSQSR